MTQFFKIREARKAAGMTQEELAKFLGINRATLSRYESGAIDPPLSQLQVIAWTLNVSLDQLCGLSPIPQKPSPDDDLLPNEFNEFEQFIESLGCYTRLEGDHYRLHKGEKSVVLSVDELRGLIRTSKATVTALIQDMIDNPPESSQQPKKEE